MIAADARATLVEAFDYDERLAGALNDVTRLGHAIGHRVAEWTENGGYKMPVNGVAPELECRVAVYAEVYAVEPAYEQLVKAANEAVSAGKRVGLKRLRGEIG